MAIINVAQAITGLRPLAPWVKLSSLATAAGVWTTKWASTGDPTAGTYNTTLNGAALRSTVVGQLRHIDPASGNSYLARFTAAASQAGPLLLCDRLWHNGGITITSTSPQTIVSPAWFARSADGTSNGDGVLLALEVSVATGVGTPTITVGYTNQSGATGRSATNVQATIGNTVAGTTYLIGLQAGDTGVRAVEGITLSATWTSGTINLVAYRPLVELPILQPRVRYTADMVQSGFPRIYSQSVPYLMFAPSISQAHVLTGTYSESQG